MVNTTLQRSATICIGWILITLKSVDKTNILCLGCSFRCLALLYWQMFRLKKDHALKYSKVLLDYFKVGHYHLSYIQFVKTTKLSCWKIYPYLFMLLLEFSKRTSQTPLEWCWKVRVNYSWACNSYILKHCEKPLCCFWVSVHLYLCFYRGTVPPASICSVNIMGSHTGSSPSSVISIPHRIHQMAANHLNITNSVLYSYEYWEVADTLAKENKGEFWCSSV